MTAAPRTRYTVTLRPDFTAKRNIDPCALAPMYDFVTEDGEIVVAFNRDPLLKARWTEPGVLDSRAAWREYGPYTLGRTVQAVVERAPKGYLKLVTLLTRGDEKVRVTE
jgi:hypothetical protein